MIERLFELVNADAALVRRGRFLTTDFLVEVGDDALPRLGAATAASPR